MHNVRCAERDSGTRSREHVEERKGRTAPSKSCKKSSIDVAEGKCEAFTDVHADRAQSIEHRRNKRGVTDKLLRRMGIAICSE